MVGAAAFGLGGHEFAELDGWGEGRQVARRCFITDRVAVVVDGGLGEHTRKLDLAGTSPPIGSFAGPACGLGRHHRHPGAVDGDVQHVRHRLGGWERNQPAGQDRSRLGGDGRRGGRPVGFGRALDPLGGQLDPAQVGQQSLALANGTASAARATIVRRPGDNDTPAVPSSSSNGASPRPHSAQ